jgi:glucan phosphoethanolaminetransferase (alkaline phosphatase superfamily)
MLLSLCIYYDYFILSCRLLGGGLLVSPDLNKSSKRFTPEFYVWCVKCLLVRFVIIIIIIIIIITVILDFAQPSQVSACVCVCVCVRAYVRARARKACNILHSTGFSTAEPSTLMNTVGHSLVQSPLASFPLPAPVRATVPLRTRHSTDEKEHYVL